MIEARTGLRELRMNHNCIREDGALAIGKALEENVYLLYLDLSWNHIRCKGAVAIANCLKSNVCLQKLDLAWNGFGKEGAQAMGQALAENSTLKELDLTNNRINANGMALLMAGLKYNETLEVLKIGQNPFNSDVAKHLLMILEQAEKSALILVEMSDVSVDEDFMAVLERLAAKSHLNVKHGKFTRKVPVKEFRPPKPPPRDPITMIYDYKYERGYRTLDLLMQLDKDNNFIIDRQEFTDGLALMGIEVAEEDIDDLMGKLDHNADGSIDYRELVEGEKEYGHREGRHMQMSTIMKIRELAKTMMQFKFKEVVDAAKNKPDGVAAQTEHAPSAGNGAGASVNAGAVKTSGSGTRAAVKK
ncbi:leucine-rich repeat-containing protein 45-like [Dreissena polymorpha]|uniref:leucine-rich repeat-containing protein 45-like n=1 Tax=Dreissena polymorpha TaxID=45954 RepID=UPI002264E998|nr:leucine-rich repeat-containing protein 45-like [Dreissena polymorpha]